MRHALLLLILAIHISGCQSYDLDSAFAKYFSLINSSKDKSQIISAKHELENIVSGLEEEQSIHLSDFQYLLNLFRAAEISWSVNDAKRMKKLIGLGMHPAHDTQLLKLYQRAKEPHHFSEAKHMPALYSALDLSKKFEFKALGKNYYFGDLVKKWSQIKGVRTEVDAAKRLAKSLGGGICSGVAMRANQLFCEDIGRSSQDIIHAINRDYDQTLLYQVQSDIAARLIKKDGQNLAKAYFQSLQDNSQFYAILPGFWLKSRVKLFLDKVISDALAYDQNFAARVSFRGNKTGHAIAIQILRGQEFRIIDNNIGVLSFDNKQDFLEIFAKYRMPYYVGHKIPVMMIFGKFCQASLQRR